MKLAPSIDLNRCPTSETIRAYANGRLDEDSGVALEQHLITCQDCETLLDACEEPSDALVQGMAALPPSDDDEAAYRSLRELLLERPPQRATAAEHLAQLDGEIRLADPSLGPLPRRLANYELIACIGRGASGAVYRARHLKLDLPVAIKVLDTACVDHSSAVVRFFQEMKAVGQLAHPNIIRATDAGESDGLHYLVMEYVDGIDASRLLRKLGPLAVADACEIGRQAAIGLQFAHDRSLVHRDVKPSNLLVTTTGDVKLLDLGIAVARTDGLGSEVVVSTPLGTAAYMAPEQWTNSAAVDARADLYSLGCMLLKLLTGGTPDPNAGTEPIQPPSLSQIRSDAPRGLDRLLQRLLASDPADRPSSAAETASALESWSRGAHLARIVARAGIAPSRNGEVNAHSRNSTRPDNVSWQRRTAITMLAASLAAALFTLRPRQWFAPCLDRTRVRPLVPVAPEILLAAGARDDVTFRVDSAQSITISSTQLALLQLGRPVVGQFKLQVDLLQSNWSGDVGLFFQGRSMEHADDPHFEFQTIELRPPDPGADDASRRLLWSGWQAVNTGNLYAATREPWAETPVNLDLARPTQSLEIVLGRTGMPSVRWNGQSLHANRWKLSTEGRNRQRVSTDHLAHAFLGRLGLVNLSGSNQFLRPRITYL